MLQKESSTVATYGYNAGGQRILKTVGADQTWCAYGPAELQGEYGSAFDYGIDGLTPDSPIDRCNTS